MMDDAREISDSAYNLAATLTRSAGPDDLPHARRLLEESRRASVAIGGDITTVLLLEAKVSRLQGDKQASASLAEQVLADPHLSRSSRLSAHLLKGELAADADDIPHVKEHLESARLRCSRCEHPATCRSGRSLGPLGIDGAQGRSRRRRF